MEVETFMHRRPEAPASSAFARRTLAALLLVLCFPTLADELDDARKLLLTGKYEQCIEACQKPSPDNFRREEWNLIHATTLLALGRYPQAEAVVSNALERSSSSVRLRWVGIETANFT